ncbi:MAG: NAD(P)-dependent oxidoreductase [Candidatus Accumulibacter sp.]|uniref:NAD(P)-dependent oxidoreductase n=1 Tax=Candidatus Accumulibacter proximus TaxID=2954385 RepID=A0A935PZY4_9PROT|nr:NAD(P)-dependent oxidoreductase [Candidatus Accumulibacter proximus]
MKVAVIGARGYVGRHLCAKLEQQGTAVLRYSAGEANGISSITGRLPEGFAFPSKLDAVCFLAQSPHYRQMPEHSPPLLSVNCVAAVQATEAARRAGVKRFVYASTGNVYAPSFNALSEGAPVRRDNWYSLSKVMAEDALALYQQYLDVSFARIFGVYGPEQEGKLVPTIIHKVRDELEVFVDRNPNDHSDVDGLRVSLIYIDDLIDALVGMLDKPHNGPVNLAGDEAVSIRWLTEEAARLLGKSPRISVGERYREFDLVADTTVYHQLFGLPKISFRAGMERILGCLG